MVTAATSVRTEELRPEKWNSTAHDFEKRLRRKVVGQDESVQVYLRRQAEDNRMSFSSAKDGSRLEPRIRRIANLASNAGSLHAQN